MTYFLPDSLTPTNIELKEVLSQVEPLDDIESFHLTDAFEWIDSGVEIYRIERPDIPPKHLVSYTVLYDPTAEKILLLHHNKALKLLPGGGHPEKGELPHEAARRELREEMDQECEFIFINDPRVPFFVSQAETVGLTAGHIDVDLWYVFEGDSTRPLNTHLEEFQREFGEYAWYTLEEILSKDIELLDPHMHRFVKKIKRMIE